MAETLRERAARVIGDLDWCGDLGGDDPSNEQIADAVLAVVAADTESIAEVLRGHQHNPDARGITPGGNPVCTCGRWYQGLADHQSAAVSAYLSGERFTQ